MNEIPKNMEKINFDIYNNKVENKQFLNELKDCVNINLIKI